MSAAVSGKVGFGGTVQVLGRRYWSPELADKIDWPVLIEIDAEDECFAAVWTKGRGRFLCTAALIADTGFADMDFARDAARKTRAEMAERRALKVQALIDFVDERIKADRDATATGFGDAITQLAQAINRGLRRAVYRLTGHDDVAEKQALDREDMVLKLGEIIFGDGHRPLQSVETGAEPNQLGEAAHRLSEVRK